MKTSKAGTAFLLICILLGGMVIGCQIDGPLGVASNPVVAQEPDFVKLPMNPSLQKIISVSGLITPQHGGELKQEFKYRYIASGGVAKDFSVKMRLKFPEGAVDDSLVASLSVDDQVLRSSVDITFNPHGSTFRKPALLDLEVRGMDVAGFSPTDQVWLYYYDNGTWVKMVAKKVEFNFKEGKIKCDEGELPHFSRYAFGR